MECACGRFTSPPHSHSRAVDSLIKTMCYAFGCTHGLEETEGLHKVTTDETFGEGHEPEGEALGSCDRAS